MGDLVTADIVDIRPDRFLRVMRDTGDWYESCKQSGMTSEEVSMLCQDNPKYDLATIECQLEYHEEQMIKVTEQAIERLRVERTERFNALRQQAMHDFHARHKDIGS
jgi:hypothetical protein